MKRAILALGLAATALGAAWLGARPAAGDDEGESKAKVIRIEAGGGGYLGVSVANLRKDDLARLKLDDQRGALVDAVSPDSPAAKAGLREGDVILRFDGEAVRSATQLSRLVRETPPGRSVGLELSRDGALQKLSCEVSARHGRQAFGPGNFEFALPPEPDGAEAPELPELPRFAWRDFGHGFHGFAPGGSRGRLGITYQPIEAQLARYFKLEAEQGLLVTGVEEDSPAARAGLKAGDVLLSFDGQKLEDAGDLREAVRSAEPGRELALKVWREGRPLELKVELPAAERPRTKGGQPT